MNVQFIQDLLTMGFVGAVPYAIAFFILHIIEQVSKDLRCKDLYLSAPYVNRANLAVILEDPARLERFNQRFRASQVRRLID